MGIPTDMFTVLFAVPRLAGWLSHWSEWMDDPENRIYRPFQIYKGYVLRDYQKVGERKKVRGLDLTSRPLHGGRR
jgi:citrate synthase